MKRREFITLLGGAAAAWPLSARAQQGGKIFRIGFLGLPTAESLPERNEAFRAGLRDLGYQEGRDYVIEYRWANGHYDRLPALLAELIASKVDVIVAHGTPGALAAKRATATIPVVVAAVGDVLGSGIVSSLSRPGGNITGSTFFQPELAAKRLELLKEAMPDITKVGILLNLTNPMNVPVLPQMNEVAGSRKVVLRQFDARGPADFEGVVEAMAASVDAFVILDDATLIAGAPAVAKLALQRRLASIGFPDYATRRRSHGLWRGLCRSVPACGLIRRQDSQRHQTGRSAVRAGDQVRDYRQSQDCQGARRRSADIDPAARRRGDRVMEGASEAGAISRCKSGPGKA
jgi:putative tryptophan/tyrosine transport system substrate-binding protein